MLSIHDGQIVKNCQGVSRRSFMQVGTLGMTGLTLPHLLATKSIAATKGASFVRDKAVVFLYLSGGASHIETFDPSMDAPGQARSITGEVRTNLPGVTFGGTFPQLAKNADKLAPVRSFTHSVGDHAKAHLHVLSGGTDRKGEGKEGFSIGSVCTSLRGANHPETGMPTYSLLTESEIDDQYQSEVNRIRKGSRPGSLGRMFLPLEYETGWRPGDNKEVRDGNPLVSNMNLRIPNGQLDDRLGLLRSIDSLKRQVDAHGKMQAVDRFSAQAIELVLGGASKAFDLSQEGHRLIERYDTSHISVGHKKFRPSTLGKQMLVARRLCEAGCGYVTVHSPGWDMHADKNNPGMQVGMAMLGRSLDKAVSAFLEDVWSRGLEQKILLVISGDFGRTPSINKNGGRDHWTKLCTLAFAGGGLRMGQVIGQSTRDAGEPDTDPITTPDLMSTVLHSMFDMGKLRLESGLSREVISLVEDGKRIEQLF